MYGSTAGRALRLFRHTCVLLAGFSMSAFAIDRVELGDGSVVLGKLKDADGGKLVFSTSFAGDIEIDQKEIRALSVDSDLVLQLDDGSIVETSKLRVANEQLLLDDSSRGSYTLAELTRINPEPWELGDGRNFTGLASISANSQSGNTDRSEVAYRLEMTWESLRDRIRFDSFGEVGEAQGVQNAENLTLRGRYDRLQTGNWYWGGGLAMEVDFFADLDQRTTLGPYVGRKFFTDPAFELEAETGVAYIEEEFITGLVRDYIGSTWDVHIKSNYLGGDSRLYLNHRGVWNLDESENLVLNTTLGLAIPLFYGIESAAEITWDLNTGAIEGTEKLDQTYRFRIGYNW